MNLVDSCGWLEYFTAGANASFFAPVIANRDKLLVPTICMYEVYRRTLDQRGPEQALMAVGLMRQSTIVPLSEQIALTAAELSIDHRLPLADSMILATAQAYKATIWTQDAHFENIPGVRYTLKI